MALGRVARVFFDNYDGFLRDDRDPHWREVNLAADASWPDRTLAPARGGANLAGCEETVGRWIARRVPRLGQVGR